MITHIDADLKQALLAHDSLKVTVLRGLKSSLKNEAIALKRALTDEDLVRVLRREAKQRDEAAAGFDQAGRPERADQERTEKTIVKTYLPEQMSDDQVGRLVDEVMIGLGGATTQDMGQIMGAVMAKVKDQSDGGTVARIVKERLGR
jgi:hypothetical protein